MITAIKRALSGLSRTKKILLGLTVSGLFGLAVPAIVLGSNNVIERLNSTVFCAQVCHSVHAAETTVYNVSEHASVPCASCHVGEGTVNLVRSKIGGIKDIIPQLAHSYELPIQTPLEDRRPSSQTCEKCHSPAKFYGDIPQIKVTYDADKSNTKTVTTHVLKVGGGPASVASGIHWHSTAKVWYVALDQGRQQMAWVASENTSGLMTQYIDPRLIGQLTPDLINSQKRLMDCVDCHNRTPHSFEPPDVLVDRAMSSRRH